MGQMRLKHVLEQMPTAKALIRLFVCFVFRFYGPVNLYICSKYHIYLIIPTTRAQLFKALLAYWTSSLVAKMLIVLVRTISDSQVFLLKKCEWLLQMQKLLTFFQQKKKKKKIAYMPYWMIKVLTICKVTTSLVLNNWTQAIAKSIWATSSYFLM